LKEHFDGSVESTTGPLFIAKRKNRRSVPL
jgi:hypothetical protein